MPTITIERETLEQFRDSVLNQLGPLAENGMTSDQINDVLGLFDDTLGAALAAQPAEPVALSKMQKGRLILEASTGMHGDVAKEVAITLCAALAAPPAPAAVPPGYALVPIEPTRAMVEAYLSANSAYWERIDAMPTKIGVWRNGTPKEATEVSYRAMIAAAGDKP